MLLAGSSFIGCSHSSQVTVAGGAAFGREVIALDQGTPVEDVKFELGEPISEFTESNGETVLHYRGWVLRFSERGLVNVIRQAPYLEQEANSASVEFDQKVLDLHWQMSIPVVETELGPPETYEEVFRNGEVVEKILRYGSWEIVFDDGKLRMRTQQ